MGRKRKQEQLQVVYPNCAGIDIGGSFHMVAVNPDLVDPGRDVRRYEAFSDDLEAMAQWLLSLGIDTVVMEATGVYWIAPYEVLERYGLDVHLVDPRSCKQVAGRKSDVLDCQWVRQLMTFGLLRSAFRPPDVWCVVRSYVRQRARLVEDQSRAVQHMQKALTEMNLQLTNVLSDIAGKTGLAIIRAIVAGERDGVKLAQLRDRRVKASCETIARSLVGTWRDEHLFALGQALARYDFFEVQIHQCEKAMLEALAEVPSAPNAPTVAVSSKRSSSKHHDAATDRKLKTELQRTLGVDLTAIPTIAIDTALVVASEVGRDLSRFSDCQHFCSWATVAPPTNISGGKTLPGRKAPKSVNRVGEALKLAARNARNNQTYIGASHRARLVRLDKAVAIKATANQLGRIIFAMISNGEPYIEKGTAEFDAKRLNNQRRALERRAKALGLVLVEQEDLEKSAA